MADRPSAASVAEKIRVVYEHHAAGCCLHCQVDDGNLENKYFDDESLAEVVAVGHPYCIEAFHALRSLRVTARRKARELACFNAEAD